VKKLIFTLLFLGITYTISAANFQGDDIKVSCNCNENDHEWKTEKIDQNLNASLWREQVENLEKFKLLELNT
jgi:hypothetical protein